MADQRSTPSSRFNPARHPAYLDQAPLPEQSVASFPGLAVAVVVQDCFGIRPSLPRVERWSAEVDQVLGQILRQAVWERLDSLDELVSSADNGSLLSAVRSELPRLAHGWRALLTSHVPDPRGRCPECSSRWRSRATSCSVWQAAHEHLVPADPMPSGAAQSAVAASSATVSGSGATVAAPKTSVTGPSWSVFSRSGIRGNAVTVRQPASLFPAVVHAGAVVVHAGAGAVR